MNETGPAPDGATRLPFEVGDWRVEPGLNRLSHCRDGRVVALEPRALDVLVLLARLAGETVSKERLLEEVWRGSFVVEGVVPKTVFGLRQALGDSANEPSYILTVPRRGYRLVAPVRWGAAASAGVVVAETGAREAGSHRRFRRSRAILGLGAGVTLLAIAAAVAWRSRTGEKPPASSATVSERLAVAPFQGSGAGETGSRLASAIRSELLGELVRLPRPQVILVEPSEPGGRGIFERASEAGARILLTGRVRAGPDSVRADLELVDVATGAPRWSVSVERPVAELYDLRRRLAAEVLDRLGAATAERRLALGGRERPIAPETYREFLEARFLWSRRGAEDLERAHELLARITREAPDFAQGFAWLALAEVTRGNYVGGEPGASYRAADRSARRALEIDPGDPVAHVASGLVAINLRLAPREAIASYRRAIDLAPSFAPAHQLLAEALSVAGRHEEAVSAADVAVALEPFSPLMHGVRGLVLHAAGRPAEALEALDRALVLDPRFGWIHRYRAYALAHLGREGEAARSFVAELAGTGTSGSELALFDAAVAREGLPGYWRVRLARMLELRAQGVEPRPTQLAEALAAVGRDEEALAALDRASREFDGEYFLHYRSSPAFDHLRDDPRFRSIYGRVAG